MAKASKSNKRLVTYLTEEDYEVIRQEAEETGRSISDYIRYILEHHVQDLFDEEGSDLDANP